MTDGASEMRCEIFPEVTTVSSRSSSEARARSELDRSAASDGLVESPWPARAAPALSATHSRAAWNEDLAFIDSPPGVESIGIVSRTTLKAKINLDNGHRWIRAPVVVTNTM